MSLLPLSLFCVFQAHWELPAPLIGMTGIGKWSTQNCRQQRASSQSFSASFSLSGFVDTCEDAVVFTGAVIGDALYRCRLDKRSRGPIEREEQCWSFRPVKRIRFRLLLPFSFSEHIMSVKNISGPHLL